MTLLGPTYRYDVTSANTDRLITFNVEPTNSGDRAANLFTVLRGKNGYYPYYGQLASPTNLQLLGQLRVSLIVRALSRYMPVVRVFLTTDAGSNANGAIRISYEADQFGLFYNNTFSTDQTQTKFLTTDITDTVGTGGMASAKTKAGLQTILDSLYNISYDGGTTGPFGNLSGASGGNGTVTLPDGTNVSSAPHLDNNGSGVTTTSGLTITFKE